MQFEAVCAHLGSLGLRVAWTPCFSLLGHVLPGVMGEPLFWQHATSLASGVVVGGVGSSLLPQVNVHVLQAVAVRALAFLNHSQRLSTQCPDPGTVSVLH